MKKTIITLIVLSVLSITPLSFAASYGKSMGASYMVVEGTIVAIDKAKNLFVIKDKDDGKAYGLGAGDSQIASLDQGDNVKVMVPLPGGVASRISK